MSASAPSRDVRTVLVCGAGVAGLCRGLELLVKGLQTGLDDSVARGETGGFAGCLDG